MTLYVDASALIKRYVAEPDSPAAEALLLSDPDLTTGRLTLVEVRRSLSVHLRGGDLVQAKARFEVDWALITVIDLTEDVCRVAADLAESTGLRSLDALHLAAAQEAGAGTFAFLTYDARQARAARALGWTVLGA